ncbi:MAG: chemotaxis protein CheD [Planctomycetes bacterium]|nr:chemotaxis protein CheD [Planctomycetota bacterium]
MAHREPVMVRSVLGSCVVVAMYDRRNQFGGVNNFLWPHTDDKEKSTATYGNVAIIGLLRLMVGMGASRKDLEAQIFGGGISPERFEKDQEYVGKDNVETARSMLARMNIPVVSEDVGGCKGRKLVFNTHTSEAAVLKVNRLRSADWLKYGQKVDWRRM